MSSTGQLVISYEVDSSSISEDELEASIRRILTPFAEAFDEMSGEESLGRAGENIEDRSPWLRRIGNTFILRILNMNDPTLGQLLERLRAVSTNAWLLIYGGLDGGPSMMIEIQNREVVTHRERAPADEPDRE